MKNILKDYITNCTVSVLKSDFEALENIAKRLIKAKENGKRIFTAGNGGSNSTASHMVNDLVKGCRVENKIGFNAMCLGDSNSVVTCLANDFSYDDIYKIQLETFAGVGDIFIAFSGSGNSQNIVKACDYAKRAGMTVIGFGGKDGGKMKPLCDICILSPTDSMEMLEDMHLMYEHALVVAIKSELERQK